MYVSYYSRKTIYISLWNIVSVSYYFRRTFYLSLWNIVYVFYYSERNVHLSLWVSYLFSSMVCLSMKEFSFIPYEVFSININYSASYIYQCILIIIIIFIAF